jgi:hypothetical protein
MSDKGDKGMIGDLTDFYKASKNFIINCQKPDRKGNFIFLINYRIYDYC